MNRRRYVYALRYFRFSIVFFIILYTQSTFAQKAVLFTDAGDYVEIPHSPSLAPSEFTVELWLWVNDVSNLTMSGEQTILDKRDGLIGYHFRLFGLDFPLGLAALAGEGNILAFGGLVSDHVWYHIAMTQDSDSLKMFVNGNLIGAMANTYDPNTSAPLRIGEFFGYPNQHFGLKGTIDDLRIWNYARSEIEIASAMHEHLSGNEMGVAAYWDFDVQNGDTIPDRTANGNSGILYGNAHLIPSEAPIGFIPPPPPLGLYAYGDGEAVYLAWKSSESEISGYNMYRDTTGNFRADSSTFLSLIAAPESTYSDLRVSLGQDYFYKLRSIDTAQHMGQPGKTAVGRPSLIFDDYMVGVAYYPWWGWHGWPGAYLRDFLIPKQPPLIGHYNSQSPSTIQQHLDWMEDHGIDFLVSSWWGQNSNEDSTLRDYILPVFSDTTIKFTVYYELFHLGEPVNGRVIIDQQKEAQLLSDFIYFANTYFNHPNFLYIDGRPVVFFYLTRILAGNYISAFANVRAELQNRGYDLYLVGDEMDWGDPDTTHMQILDAVSPYIMCCPNYEGYPLESEFFTDVTRHTHIWEETCQSVGIDFIPNVHPGVNIPYGHGTRYAIPRQMTEGASHTSTYEEYIKVMRSYVDPDLRMMMITSWNEWHEDTQIEPTIVTSATNVDISGVGFYTQGFFYKGYSTDFLESTRNLLAPGITVGNSSTADPSSPHQFNLLQNFPNPFNPTTAIRYQISQSTFVELVIHNILGQKIRTLVNQEQSGGNYEVYWDGKNEDGHDVTSGMYLYRLSAGPFNKTRKMLLLR